MVNREPNGISGLIVKDYDAAKMRACAYLRGVKECDVKGIMVWKPHGVTEWISPTDMAQMIEEETEQGLNYLDLYIRTEDEMNACEQWQTDHPIRAMLRRVWSAIHAAVGA